MLTTTASQHIIQYCLFETTRKSKYTVHSSPSPTECNSINVKDSSESSFSENHANRLIVTNISVSASLPQYHSV